jgi:hypothetical protein
MREALRLSGSPRRIQSRVPEVRSASPSQTANATATATHTAMSHIHLVMPTSTFALDPTPWTPWCAIKR